MTMTNPTGEITKVVPCKANLDREFFFTERVEDHIGIRSLKHGFHWWLNESQIASKIETLERDLKFYYEAREVFDEEYHPDGKERESLCPDCDDTMGLQYAKLKKGESWR